MASGYFIVKPEFLQELRISFPRLAAGGYAAEIENTAWRSGGGGREEKGLMLLLRSSILQPTQQQN